eukprot:102460_1
MEVETSRSSKGKSMRRPKAPKNYDQCSALQITCNGINNEIVLRIMCDIQTLNESRHTTIHLKEKEHVLITSIVKDMNAHHEEEVKALQQTISDECRTYVMTEMTERM